MSLLWNSARRSCCWWGQIFCSFVEVLYGALQGTHRTGGFIFNIVTAVREKKLCCFLGNVAAL